MSTDNTDRTAPQAPLASDDAAPSSPTTSTPTARTQATDRRSQEATANPADQPAASPSLASFIGKANRVSQSSSPAPQATAAQDGDVTAAGAATSTGTGTNDADTADTVKTVDDAAHDGAGEKGAEATDDGGDTLNLREQASFPTVGSQAAESAETTKTAAAGAQEAPTPSETMTRSDEAGARDGQDR